MLYAADPEPRSAEGRRLDQLRDHIREQSWYGDGGGRIGEPAGARGRCRRSCRLPTPACSPTSVDAWVTAVVVTGTDAHTVPLCEAKPVGQDLDRVAADLDIAASIWRVPSPRRSAARWTSGSGSSPTSSSRPCSRWWASVASC